MSYVDVGLIGHRVQTRKGPVSRISDLAVVPYRQASRRAVIFGVRRKEPATEGDTLWVNYSTRRFSSRSMVF